MVVGTCHLQGRQPLPRERSPVSFGQISPSLVFRWFKFTLIAIVHDKLQLAIWDTSFRTFWLKIWTQGTLRHILGPILVIFEICQFLMIPGPFEYFSENGWSRKIKVFLMKERSLPLIGLVLGGDIPRLNHGPICFPIPKTLKGVLWAVKSWVPLFWHFHKGLKCTYYWWYCINNLSIGWSA